MSTYSVTYPLTSKFLEYSELHGLQLPKTDAETVYLKAVNKRYKEIQTTISENKAAIYHRCWTYETQIKLFMFINLRLREVPGKIHVPQRIQCRHNSWEWCIVHISTKDSSQARSCGQGPCSAGNMRFPVPSPLIMHTARLGVYMREKAGVRVMYTLPFHCCFFFSAIRISTTAVPPALLWDQASHWGGWS